MALINTRSRVTNLPRVYSFQSNQDDSHRRRKELGASFDIIYFHSMRDNARLTILFQQVHLHTRGVLLPGVFDRQNQTSMCAATVSTGASITKFQSKNQPASATIHSALAITQTHIITFRSKSQNYGWPATFSV